MAQRIPSSRAEFDVSVGWPPRSQIAQTGAGAEPDGSVGELTITVRDTPVTAYKRDRGDVGTSLTLPLYYLAEWISVNWWALLFEPEKGEKAEDNPEFRARHWMGIARNGFALPDLWFLPAGDKIDLSAESIYLRFARLTFTERVDESVPLASVQEALSSFVTTVLSRLNELGVTETDAHQAWELVQNTTPEQEQYCRLIGSLGLSPYDDNIRIDKLLDELSGKLDERILVDLFQAADIASLDLSSELAQRVYRALPSASEINIGPLADIILPEDRSPQAWRWGVEATTNVRASMGITKFDPQGGDAFFERLGIDLAGLSTVPSDGGTDGQITAGLERIDDEMRLAIVGDSGRHSRFAAARAAFLAWIIPTNSSRLITRARTREQQASRAFAAEMLAPIGYIRRRIGGAHPISSYRAEEIADELNVSPQVVEYQARNNKIGIWHP
jgi:hypothetical protein